MAVAVRTNPRRTARRSVLRAAPVVAAIMLGLAGGVAFSGILTGALRGAGGFPPIGGQPTPVPLPTSSPTPQSPMPTLVPTPEPTAVPTLDPTVAPTRAPTLPPTPEPTAVPTPMPTVRPTPAPTPTPPAGPPACRYDDVLTPHRGLESWAITLLDTIYMLPSGYAPGDLVDSSAAGLNGGYPVRRFVVADLAAMVADARAAGADLAVVSGYRSHAQQAATFQYWVNVAGYEAALRTSARAGHSEHQLGTTLDFTTAGGAAPWEYADWATTHEGGWMATHAWRYGFVMSYPRGSFAQTCYDYEPWHYRYVGRDLAARIHASGLSPREVLWALQ